ncbi:Lrp/AsnC family transcriptional regulator [Sphingosinicella rhizophila]|uniref:Lrp/AsnC family transcriptional regulator n=1 Tax=Sphingosinicella rhizophila TaxID=3050082 RepID=A0ABU3QAQ9_9SPHN|nr:Lrp/AsnC family transcriptional regulator [Sphingosinicella sp. GR2756]MDT9600487.1 Lrp/AsnC family transcriptional regulator [Sphingosinicella sp. GR2756]
MTSPPASHDLDRFDRDILAILQQDNMTTQRRIGEAIGLSAPAVQRRIRRMEASGFIVANMAVVNPDLVGRPLTIFVEVEVESERTDRIDGMKRRFADAPEVQQCYYVTGDADFVLVVTVSSMGEYEALTRRLFFADDNVRRFKTFITMDRVKTGLAVPV